MAMGRLLVQDGNLMVSFATFGSLNHIESNRYRKKTIGCCKIEKREIHRK